MKKWRILHVNFITSLIASYYSTVLPSYVAFWSLFFFFCDNGLDYAYELEFMYLLQMWILGNPIKFEGLEYADKKAVYICNHASPIDIFLIMWLTPTGTVGIAKKEVKSLLLKSVICWLFMSGIRSIMLTAMQGAMIHEFSYKAYKKKRFRIP